MSRDNKQRERSKQRRASGHRQLEESLRTVIFFRPHEADGRKNTGQIKLACSSRQLPFDVRYFADDRPIEPLRAFKAKRRKIGGFGACATRVHLVFQHARLSA